MGPTFHLPLQRADRRIGPQAWPHPVNAVSAAWGCLLEPALPSFSASAAARIGGVLGRGISGPTRTSGPRSRNWVSAGAVDGLRGGSSRAGRLDITRPRSREPLLCRLSARLSARDSRRRQSRRVGVMLSRARRGAARGWLPARSRPSASAAARLGGIFPGAAYGDPPAHAWGPRGRIRITSGPVGRSKDVGVGHCAPAASARAWEGVLAVAGVQFPAVDLT